MMKSGRSVVVLLLLVLIVACGGSGDGDSISGSRDGSAPAPAVGSSVPPTSLIAVAGNGQIEISWAAVTGEVRYNLYYATESFAGITDIANYASLAGAGVVEDISDTRYTLMGLTNSTSYYVVVTAVDESESAMSSQASAMPISLTGLSCTLKSEGGPCDEMMPTVYGGVGYALRDVNAAGKTYCMEPSDALKGLSIHNVTGAPGNPVTIVNCGGKVTLDTEGWQVGISIKNSRYIHLSGVGSADDFYGIHVINAGGAGLDATDGSSDIEVDHVQIDDAGGSGILVRTYPFTDICHTEWTRSQFTQYNTLVHDNFINGARWEGLYIGTSHYEKPDGPSGTVCDGQSAPQASLVGVKIYNNRIERTGNDGIQLGGAISGVEVYNNTVRDYALHNTAFHAGGLQLNPGTSGRFYNNYIAAHPDADTAKGLMYTGGEGELYVYNNVFVGGEKAIMTLNRMANNTDFFYTNNTYYGRGTGNTFYFFCNLLPEEQAYTIKNNIFTEYASIGSDSTGGWNYFNGSNGSMCPMNGEVITGYGSHETDLHMSQNYFAKSSSGILFGDPANEDFTLATGSPAAGMGADLSVIMPLPAN